MLRKIWFALLWVLSCQSWAADEYSTVLLSAESEATPQLVRQGLAQVLVQLTGESAISKLALVQKALASSDNYLATSQPIELDGQPAWQLSYSILPIDALFQQLEQGYWGGQRTPMLVWLVVDNGNERRIIWDQDSSDYDQLVRQAARQYGVPLQMPIGDLDDVMALHVPDLWGGFSQPIANASVRYQAKGVLVIMVKQNGLQPLQAQWQLWDLPASRMAGQRASVTGRAQVGEQGALADVFAQIVRYHAKRNAPKEAAVAQVQASGLSLRVYQIHNSTDYFQLERMLKGLTSVAAVQLRNITGDHADVELTLLTSEAQFYQDLRNDGRIVEKPLPRSKPVSDLPAETTLAPLTTVETMSSPQGDDDSSPHVVHSESSLEQTPTTAEPLAKGLFWSPDQRS